MKTVYMCFGTDSLHGGHVNIISKAAQLGELTVGILTNEAIAEYKRYPLLDFDKRRIIFESIKGVSHVVTQTTMSYADAIKTLRPDIIVHGTDWLSSSMRPVRDEVIELLKKYGGELVEFPYADDMQYEMFEEKKKEVLSSPEVRRARLKRLLRLKPLVTAIEAHSGITGLIAENTKVQEGTKVRQFDAMWISSLCDSTSRGKPDIELVDMSARMNTINDIMEVTTKPLIVDGDTGGLAEHFVYNVRSLERVGVSAVIIEDKTGLKRNSLFGTEVEQTQENIDVFCNKIAAGKNACRTEDFMIIARVESLIAEKGMEDALIRAKAYVAAGADGIMIHSRKKSPDEIFEFVEKFRLTNTSTPIIVVPSTFSSVKEEEFAKYGVNIVIYANQLTRSGFKAMQATAEMILKTHRADEADEMCLPLSQVISLIPHS